MHRFTNPYGGENDRWFRVGSVDVTTTIFVVALGVLSMFVWAAEGAQGPIFERLILVTSNFDGVGSVLEGQVWRLLTWPIPNEPDIFAIILFAVFYMLGSQLESVMGRRLFTIFLLSITVGPALLVTLVEAISGLTGFDSGLRSVELGVLVAFAAHYPRARFWPGIPAWGLAAGIVTLEVLQLLGTRDNVNSEFDFLLLFSVLAIALLLARSMGFAEEVHWLPKLPLPASLGGEPSRGSRSASGRPRGRRRKGNLRSVPPPTPSVDNHAERLQDMDIDNLLDQVSSQGIDSLTKEQRKRLEEHAKRLRKREQ